MEESNSHKPPFPLSLHLKRVTVERDQEKQIQVQKEEPKVYIFSPKTDLEEAAIAVAIEGSSGWKDALYSLDYVDRHLEHTCFIFATRPKESRDQQWLLVNLDGKSGSKYWIVLGEKQLSEVYYAWAKVVQKTNPHFNPHQLSS